tara:strand:- start:208 stop:351 length:144 start_codon:yes stop_codon:yes gene_type:complete
MSYIETLMEQFDDNMAVLVYLPVGRSVHIVEFVLWEDANPNNPLFKE